MGFWDWLKPKRGQALCKHRGPHRWGPNVKDREGRECHHCCDCLAKQIYVKLNQWRSYEWVDIGIGE